MFQVDCQFYLFTSNSQNCYNWIIERVFDKAWKNTPKKIVKMGKVSGLHAVLFAFACELLAMEAVWMFILII